MDVPNNQPTNQPPSGSPPSLGPINEQANELTDNPLSAAQLSDIKAQLDLVLMAIEALTNIGSDAVLEAAKALRLEHLLADRVGLWRLRQSSPLRKGQGRKKLDVEEARALVLVVCRLCAAHHSRIRQAVATLEQATQQGEPPHRAAILGDYLDNFSNLYSDRMAPLESSSTQSSSTQSSSTQSSSTQSSSAQSPSAPSPHLPNPPSLNQTLTQLSFRLLIDLLFYSASGGERQLWLALLDRAAS